MENAKMVLSQQYSPTMTKDYSRISDTARAVNAVVLPRMASYIRHISPYIAAMSRAGPGRIPSPLWSCHAILQGSISCLASFYSRQEMAVRSQSIT